jgi:hypothetical protein
MAALADLADVWLYQICDLEHGRPVPDWARKQINQTLDQLKRLRAAWPSVPLDFNNVFGIKKLLRAQQHDEVRP